MLGRSHLPGSNGASELVSSDPSYSFSFLETTYDPVSSGVASPPTRRDQGAAAPNLYWAERQIALERLDFSCGCIDNRPGSRTEAALKAYQQSRELPVSGSWDEATQQDISLTELFTTYRITPEDAKAIMPPPQTVLEKSQASRLGYYSLEQLLAEKFHLTKAFLHELNPQVEFQAGSEVRVPNFLRASTLANVDQFHAASLRISLSERSIEALDVSGKIIAHFPCSIAADKLKRPTGQLTVVNYAPNPNYTFDPALFPELASQEHLTTKLIFPPGPNNPVGLVWIGLSLPSYGIHGTPEPENIGKTYSHGCFRMTNWDVARLLQLIRIGLFVEIAP